MSDFDKIFLKALENNEHKLINTFIALFPDLARKDEAVSYLRVTAKSKDLKQFKFLIQYGEWAIDFDKSKTWSFLKTEGYKPYLNFTREFQDKSSIIPEAWAASHALNDEAILWMRNALFLITGTKPDFSSQTIFFEGKEPFKGNHLRIQVAKEDLAMKKNIIARLNIFGIQHYSEIIKGTDVLITIPQTAFKKIVDILQYNFSFDTKKLDFEKLVPRNSANDNLCANYFKHCFMLKSIKMLQCERMLDEKQFEWPKYLAWHYQVKILQNLNASIKDWVRLVALDWVPTHLYYKEYSARQMEAFKFISKKLHLPLIMQDSDLASFSLEQQANLFRLCAFDDWSKDSLATKYHKYFSDYQNYTRHTLSTFLPKSIQNIKEITAWVPMESYTPSFSLSQESQGLEADTDIKSNKKALSIKNI